METMGPCKAHGVFSRALSPRGEPSVAGGATSLGAELRKQLPPGSGRTALPPAHQVLHARGHLLNVAVVEGAVVCHLQERPGVRGGGNDTTTHLAAPHSTYQVEVAVLAQVVPQGVVCDVLAFTANQPPIDFGEERWGKDTCGGSARVRRVLIRGRDPPTQPQHRGQGARWPAGLCSASWLTQVCLRLSGYTSLSPARALRASSRHRAFPRVPAEQRAAGRGLLSPAAGVAPSTKVKPHSFQASGLQGSWALGVCPSPCPVTVRCCIPPWHGLNAVPKSKSFPEMQGGSCNSEWYHQGGTPEPLDMGTGTDLM